MSFDESQAVNDNLCKKKPGTLKGRWESAIDRSKSIESTKVDAVKNNTLSQFRSNSGTGIVKSRVDAIKFIIQSPNPDAVLDATVLASRAMVKQRLIDSYTRHQRKLAKQKMDAITWDSINQSISTVSNPPVSSLSDMRPLDKYKKPLRVAKEMTANENLQPLEHTHVSASHMIDIETRTNAVEDVLRGDGATAQISSCKEDEYDSEEEGMVIDEDGLNIYQSGCTRLYSMNQLRLLLSTTGSSAKTEYELFEFLKSKNHEVDVPLLFACGVSDADSGLSRSGVDVEHVLVDIVALVLTVESNTFVAITITCKYRDDCPVKRVKRRIALLDPSNNNVLLEMDVVVTGGIVAFPQISPEHVDQESDSDDESSGSEDGSAFSGEPDVKSDEKVALTNTSEPQIESVIADDLVCNVPLRPRSPTVIPISERSTTTDASLQWFPPARASSAPSTPSKREVPPTGEAVATLDAHSSSLLSPAPISARTAARLARLSISPSTGKFMPTPSPQLPSAPAPHPSAVVEVDDVEFDGTPVEYSKHSTVIENSGDVGLFDSLDDIIGMTCSDTHLVVQYSSKGQHRVIVVKYCRSGNESVLKSCVLNYDSVMIVRGSRLVEYVRRSCMSG